VEEYSYNQIMNMHSDFLALAVQTSVPAANFCPPAATVVPVVMPAVAVAPDAAQVPTEPPQRQRVVLPTPASFANWPFHFSAADSNSSYIGTVSERVIEPNGSHLWRVSVPTPHVDRWFTTAQLVKHINIETSIAQSTSKPARVVPVAHPFTGFMPAIDDVRWTRNSAFVGVVVTTTLSNIMTANWKATRDRAAASAPARRRKGGKPPLYAVTIEAVFVGPPGSPVQCLGRCHFDNNQCVIFTDIRDVSEGSFTHILPKPGWGHTGRSISLAHPMGSIGLLITAIAV
jgi:hypothetical protein